MTLRISAKIVYFAINIKLNVKLVQNAKPQEY